MTNRLTYTVPEVADLLGLSARTIYRAVTEGRLPSIRLGHRVLIPAQALQTWIAQGTLMPEPARNVAAARVTQTRLNPIPIRRSRRRVLSD